MIYLIIIIIVIILGYYCINRDKYWKDKPVSRKELKYNGYITNNFTIPNNSNKYKTYIFSPNMDLNHIIHFMNNNSNYLYNDNNVDIDIELFRYDTINSDSNLNNYLIIYDKSHKKNIIGLLVNSPVNLYFYNNILSTNHIKYIVINHNYNYNSIFSILFSNNIKNNIYQNYKSFIFTKDKYKYNLIIYVNVEIVIYIILKKLILFKILLYKNNNNIDRFFDFYNTKINI